MTVLLTPVTITAGTGLAAHADGRPIACTDATAVVVFVYQNLRGLYVVDIHTRHDDAEGQVLVLFDQVPLLTPGTAATAPRRGREARDG